MNAKYILLLFSIFLLFAFACRKQNEEVYNSLKVDTIYPSTHFPAYPGSSWKYLTYLGDTFNFNVEPNYVKHSFSYGDAETGIFQTALAYVPKWNGYQITYGSFNLTSFYVYQYTAFPEYDVTYRPIYKILSVNLGENWIIVSDSKYSRRIDRRVTAVDTSINVLGKIFNNVIIMEDYWYDNKPTSPLMYKYYYAKDIGLIKQESATDTLLSLIDYKINH